MTPFDFFESKIIADGVEEANRVARQLPGNRTSILKRGLRRSLRGHAKKKPPEGGRTPEC
jgi:hypothetical protein